MITNDMVQIRPEMIIIRGITTQKGLCNTEYIVFQEDGEIIITGEQNGWRLKDNNIYVYPSYTRLIAKSMEEFIK